MKNIYTIIKKELSAYFNSPIAYIFLSVFLLSSAWLFFQNFFLNNQVSMRNYFYFLPWLFLIFIPAITMRSFAEEKKNGTLEILLTLPIKDSDLVLGKFLAGFIFVLTAFLFSLVIPVSIKNLGDLDFGPIIGGYLGAFLLAGSYLSLGVFISSLSKNQIVAFILSMFITFVLFIIGTPFVLNFVPGFMTSFFSFLGIGSHFNNIARGVIDTRDLVYYFSFIFFFIWLTVKNLESRNYN